MLYETDAGDLIDFARRWADLGDAVAEQVARVVDDPSAEDINPNAIELARGRIGGLNEGVDQAFEEYFVEARA